MKVAYLHVLPLEYYPPARNTLKLLAGRKGWEVRAWTSPNRRHLQTWTESGIDVSRRADADAIQSLPRRMVETFAWHSHAANEIARWKPDALISVEPHSALAAWLYYRVFGGKAALFIHHHEYYSPADFLGAGMRTLRWTARLERDYLFPRANWVSQTNSERLQLVREWTPQIHSTAAQVLPNFPPSEWIEKARRSARGTRLGQVKLVYVGSASFEDTFIREVATWVASRPNEVALHVVSDNIPAEVWRWLRSLQSPSITLDEGGCDYRELPALLPNFDVGLVLYKGNTQNFIHNVPNKAIEYLACELDVWYPPEMAGMRHFHEQHPDLPLKEVNFRELPDAVPPAAERGGSSGKFAFTCEAAVAPLIAELERAAISRSG